MTSDTRAWLARESHLQSKRLAEQAATKRKTRDNLVRILRREDPDRWTYSALAGAVGCSPELIAVIIRSDKEETHDA